MKQEEIEKIRAERIKRAKKKAERRKEWARRAEEKAEKLQQEIEQINKGIPMGQPILVGHHSEKRHRRDLNKIDNKQRKIVELQKKAKKHREKAKNIMLYQTRVKGDAERKREKIRQAQDIVKGDKVEDFAYGVGEVVRVNKKTYRIRFESGWTTRRDKTFVSKVK